MQIKDMSLEQIEEAQSLLREEYALIKTQLRQMETGEVPDDIRRIANSLIKQTSPEELVLLEQTEYVKNLLLLSGQFAQDLYKDTNAELAKALEILQNSTEVEKIAKQISKYIRLKRKKRQRLVEQTKDQPAGVPQESKHESLTLILAKRYTKKNRESKKPTKESREETEKKRKSYIDSMRKKYCAENPDSLSEPTEEMLEQHLIWKESPFGEWLVRRMWYSSCIGGYAYIVQHPKTGKCKLTTNCLYNETSLKIQLYINTYAASRTYKVDAEKKAMQCLRAKVDKDQFERYIFTGTIFERSKRTGLVYIFRRARPTIVFREFIDEQGRNNQRFVAALCGHSQGYYSTTWAGTMVPTDDVVAHILMMRSDEYKFWKVCTQHGEFSPQAAV
jgi:hypothetical protein